MPAKFAGVHEFFPGSSLADSTTSIFEKTGHLSFSVRNMSQLSKLTNKTDRVYKPLGATLEEVGISTRNDVA